MIWTRREFIGSSSAALAAGLFADLRLLAQAQPAPATRFETLRGGVGLFHGRGGTIGWFVSPDAVIVIDSQFPETAQVCLADLQKKSSRGIDALINTHHHGDHTGGNKVFRAAAKKIVAHANVPKLQKNAAAQQGSEADQAYPDTTFDTTWKMDLGGETVSAKHYGAAHTGGDIAVTFERANIVHLGDLLFNHRHPFVDRPAGASIRGWMDVMTKIAADHGDDTLYVFGHAKEGFPVTGKKADLMTQRDYFAAVVDHVQKGIAAGRSKEEVTKLAALEKFADYAEAPPRLTLAGVLGVAYDELTTKSE